jgi:hypothetical protein
MRGLVLVRESDERLGLETLTSEHPTNREREVLLLLVGLLNPLTADVQLALHSHGPAGSGQVLKAQLSSFLGGCQTFLGPDGIADGPEDMPVAVGECTTFQYSNHQP